MKIECLIFVIVILIVIVIVIYTLKNNEINLFCYCCNWYYDSLLTLEQIETRTFSALPFIHPSVCL